VDRGGADRRLSWVNFEKKEKRLERDTREFAESSELQPATSGAGGLGPPTQVGAGTGGDDEDEFGGKVPRRQPTDPIWMDQFRNWWSVPIEDLNLSMRAYNCLRRSGLLTVGLILVKSEEELIALRNFGRRSFVELREKSEELGILPFPPTA
jgi:DNA-directed RNA polymerase alpha subunit